MKIIKGFEGETLEVSDFGEWVGKDYIDYKFEYENNQKVMKSLCKENQELKEQLDCALEILSEMFPPCEKDGFMDKHSDYCQLNCGVDEEVFKKCWLLYIKDKLKEVE